MECIKKRIKSLAIGILFIISFFGVAFLNSALAAETQPISSAFASPEISIIPVDDGEEKAPNEALQVLKDRQKKIQETFKKSDIEEEGEAAQSDLDQVQLEKKALETVKDEIDNEVTELQKKIAEQEIMQNSLQLAEQQNVENSKKVKDLEISKEGLKKDLEIKNNLLEKNKKDLEKLSKEEALKEYVLDQNVALQQALKDKNSGEFKGKLWIFSGVTLLFFLVYVLRLFLAKKICATKKLQKRYGHKFVAFDIIIFLSYLGFIVWFVFYLRPEMVVYLLFLVGAIVMVLQEYIFSVVSSVFIVQGYKVGERVRYKGEEGIIENINLLKVFIRTIDAQGTNMQELRIIPNSQFMKNEVVILPRNHIEKTLFKIILPNDLSIELPRFMTHIEENVLQKNITVKSINEITEIEYFYEVDFSFMRTGQPVIELTWQETREKSTRIKRKILAELEMFKKQTQPLEANRDDND